MVFGKYFDCYMFFYLVCLFALVLGLIPTSLFNIWAFWWELQHLLFFFSYSLLWLLIALSLSSILLLLLPLQPLLLMMCESWMCEARIKHPKCVRVSIIFFFGCLMVQYTRILHDFDATLKKRVIIKIPFCVRVGKNNKWKIITNFISSSSLFWSFSDSLIAR